MEKCGHKGASVRGDGHSYVQPKGRRDSREAIVKEPRSEEHTSELQSP